MVHFSIPLKRIVNVGWPQTAEGELRSRLLEQLRETCTFIVVQCAVSAIVKFG